MNSIWDKAQKTDARYVKRFQRAGGFSGTAINPTWLAKRATEEFGPCGFGWGIEPVREEWVSGPGGVVVHVLLARLWYKFQPVNGTTAEVQRGEILQYGQTTFVNEKGRVDEEAPKKSLTDAMSKCLSLLGFASDVYLGLWDDSKYVAEREREAAEAERAGLPNPAVLSAVAEEQARVRNEDSELADGLIAMLPALTDEDSVASWCHHNGYTSRCLASGPKVRLWNALRKHVDSLRLGISPHTLKRWIGESPEPSIEAE
jgi:hypothetical protein